MRLTLTRIIMRYIIVFQIYSKNKRFTAIILTFYQNKQNNIFLNKNCSTYKTLLFY